MELVKCPHCGFEIEKDSVFCDQCGKELKKCPTCGRICRGTFCPEHGDPAVPASQYKGQSESASSAPAPQPQQPAPQIQQPPRPTTSPGFAQPPTATTLPQNDARPTRINCVAMGVSLPLINGAIIGRVYGNYAPQLAAFQAISGTHARLDDNGGQWFITDMKSRFGTMLNGVPVVQPTPIKKGDIIRFGQTYDFIVE